MKTIQCIITLACIAICTSTTIKVCRCRKEYKAIRVALIADVKVIEPRPYCPRQEILVTLKDNSLKCLDPNAIFTKTVLLSMSNKKPARAAKMNTTRSKTATAPATTSATSSSS